MELSHIEGSQVLHAEGQKPAFDLRFAGGGERLTVVDRGADACSEQFHLIVPVSGAIIEAEKLRTAGSGDSAFDHRHQVFEVVVQKHICGDDKAAGIIDQGDEVDTLFPLRSGQVRPVAGVPIPYFIDVGTFIAAHILIFSHAFLRSEMSDKAFNGRLRYLPDVDAAAGEKMSVYLSSRDTGMLCFQEADLGFQILIEFTADPFILPGLWEKAFETVFLIAVVPFFYCGGSHSLWSSIRSCIGFGSCLAEELIVADVGVAGPGLERGDHPITEQCDLLFLVYGHGGHRLSRMVSPESGIRPCPHRK